MNSFNILASLRNATSEVAENIINSCSSDDTTFAFRETHRVKCSHQQLQD